MRNENSQPFDMSEELLIQRYRQGVRLIRPNSYTKNPSQPCIRTLFNLPTQVYFKDHDTKIVGLNSSSLKILDLESRRDAINKSWADFATRTYAETVLQSDLAILNSANMQVLEESGQKLDGLLVQTISFKFPWYQNEKVIGLFGCSINIDPDHIGDFGKTMAQFMATGLLGHAPSSPAAFLPELKDGDIYFSKREREVLGLLVRGKTAKEIGVLLQISKRTAENHIKSAKSKASCSSKSELIDKFVDRFI